LACANASPEAAAMSAHAMTDIITPGAIFMSPLLSAKRTLQGKQQGKPMPIDTTYPLRATAILSCTAHRPCAAVEESYADIIGSG
jgi:hypothetical protein